MPSVYRGSRWSGARHEPDITRCAASVGSWRHESQCAHPPKYSEGDPQAPLTPESRNYGWCGLHAPSLLRAKNEADRAAEHREYSRKQQLRLESESRAKVQTQTRGDIKYFLQLLAAGEYDPATLPVQAQELLNKM